MAAIRNLVPWVLASALGACGLPPLGLLEDPSVPIAPSGPPVAALLANVKCELWEAANDNNELPYYLDEVGLPLHRPSTNPSPDHAFTLENLFAEIEYVAELKLTLEVTDTGALNPSANFIKPLPLPASTTNLTLAVGGQVYSSNDRIFDLYQSVDFQRLVASLEHPLYNTKNWKNFRGIPPPKAFANLEPGQASSPYVLLAGSGQSPPCDRGLGLHGRLGLREALATSAIAARMQDVAVLVKTGGTSGGTVYGQTPLLSGFNGYAFGEMDTTINFTVSVDINGGPNWTLSTFKGPNVSSAAGANGQGLGNLSRLSKDSLVLTVIPVCIRQKYFPQQWEPCKYYPHQKQCLKPDALKPVPAPTPSFDGKINGRVQNGTLEADLKVKPAEAPKTQLPPITFPAEYDPEMNFGTPIWANYLPPCRSPEGLAAIAAAPAAAKTQLQLQGLDNLLRLQRRF